MFEAFSQGALKIIFLARYEAGRLRSDNIDLSHLLLGFILEDQGRSESQQMGSLLRLPETSDSQPIAFLNTTQRITNPFLDSLTAGGLQSIFSRPGPRSESQPTYGDMPLTEEAQYLLSSAIENAGESAVTSLHLLRAMLDDRAGLVANALREKSVTRESIDQEIQRRRAEDT